MKHDCDVVRDLMPMCIDNTASENSRQMVGEHVLECKKCREMYQEMRTEVPKDPPVSKEAQPFTTTVRKLRKKRRTRKIVIGVIGAVVAICIQGIVSGWMDVLSIYICPLGAGLAAIMFFWVCGKKFVEEQVNTGREKPIGSWFFPLCKYVLTPVCFLVLVFGAVMGGIG